MPASLLPRLGDHLTRAARDTNLVAVIHRLVPDPCRLAGLRVDMGDIRDLDRQFLFDDAARVAHARLRMPAGNVNPLHDDAVVGWEDAQDLARLALVATADDDHVVALFDLQFGHRTQSTPVTALLAPARRSS